MSDTNEAKPTEAPGAAPTRTKAKGGGAAMVLGMLIPGLLAGAASFGGARVATGHPPPAVHAETSGHSELKAPGPTIALDPFLVALIDGQKKAHPMKLTVAVEFEALAKEDTLKPFIPRIRDAILAHMRSLSYDEAVDQTHAPKLRDELLERCRKAGATNAERVLITDLVSQ